jgi:hypothetical protein
MLKSFIAILAVAAILFIVSVATGSRIAAGGGAVLLLGGLIYGYLYNKSGSQAQVDRAERGAAELREDLDREDNP